MALLEVVDVDAPTVRAAIVSLVEGVTRRIGRRPLADHLWVDLVHAARPGAATVVARGPDAATVVGLCQLSPGADGWVVGLVLADDADLPTVGADLLRRACAVVVAAGGGRVHWWVTAGTGEEDTVATAVGFRHDRTLLQMRVDLPLPGSADLLDTRPFRVGADEQAFLEVNNAAFAGHAEQGGWDLATLRQREEEDWFDPAGFLLHWRDGELAGFCWTKLHDEADGRTGEIYVIGVHPRYHGHGLGRALTRAGLHSIAARGVRRGMLFVDADNPAATELYRSLGFHVTRTDRAFVADVAPATQEAERP